MIQDVNFGAFGIDGLSLESIYDSGVSRVGLRFLVDFCNPRCLGSDGIVTDLSIYRALGQTINLAQYEPYRITENYFRYLQPNHSYTVINGIVTNWGVLDYLDFVGESFTVNLCVDIGQLTGREQFIIKGISTLRTGWGLSRQNAILQYHYSNTYVGGDQLSTALLSNTGKYFLTMVIDKVLNVMRVYLNGELKTSRSIAGIEMDDQGYLTNSGTPPGGFGYLGSYSYSLRFGEDAAVSLALTSGIGHVSIYDRAFTNSEVMDIYNRLKPIYSLL